MTEFLRFSLLPPGEGARRADEGSGGDRIARLRRTLSPTPLPEGEGLCRRRIALHVCGRFAMLAVALALAGCATLEPRQPAADAQLIESWPLPPDAARADASAPVREVGWRDFFADARLQQTLALALENNRDLRIAALNVERAQAQYRIQRADRVPSLSLDASLQRTGGSAGRSDLYGVDLGLASFELDLFGRVRNLSDAALRSFLATEEAQRSVQLALIAEVANAWLTLAADEEQVRIAAATLETQQASFALSEKRHELGAISALDVSQLRTVVEASRVELARYRGLVAQDRNALRLLVGAPLSDALLPSTFEPLSSGLPALPANLPSEALLRRPDVIAAEYRLSAQNADIGAARAAFFPSIRLTASAGSASDEFSGLFESGTDVWSFVPRISLPIFQGGRLRAALGVATADRDIALAEYERTIQQGFRDVADALALSRTLAEQRAAQEALVAAAARGLELSNARYEAGQDSYLLLLDAQRTEFAARQALIATQLAEQVNRVNLYRALGGGWTSEAPP
jgi:multidrug efflux system outer membrane protein